MDISATKSLATNIYIYIYIYNIYIWNILIEQLLSNKEMNLFEYKSAYTDNITWDS